MDGKCNYTIWKKKIVIKHCDLQTFSSIKKRTLFAPEIIIASLHYTFEDNVPDEILTSWSIEISFILSVY